MKHLMATFMFFTLLIFSAGYTQGNKPQKPQEKDMLNLTKIKIESTDARTLLKSDSILVRKRKTDYEPKGELPVLKLETINDDICRQRLLKVVQKHSQKDVTGREMKNMGDIFVIGLDDVSYWISRASGAYKFTETKNSMATPTKVEHFKEAVQMALDYLGKNQLIELIDGEEIDILFVSAVKNALTIVDEIKPQEEFISDYYVGFGRRFKGVPIIGSRLVIRLNGNGDIVMVQKTWRQIVEVSTEKAVISRKSIQEIITKDPIFYERHGKDRISPKEITIIDKQCGYMEAPVNYDQEYLRPGCNVSYRIGKSADETYPQIIIPLEDGGNIQKLWGRKYKSKQQK